MRPTNPPDDGLDSEGMPQEYGMYDLNGGEYDEDDFFYHMYFDEVSTTPLPDEFYDILESVSAGSNPQPAAYPDYFDYFLNEKKIKNVEETTTEISSRQSKNTRYLRWKNSRGRNQTRPSSSRRNSKYMKSIKHGLSRPPAPRPNSKLTRSRRSLGKTRKVKQWEKHLRLNKKKTRRFRKAGRRFRQGRGTGRGIIGILDRRVPPQFRQAEFITISLATFVILSTGVTTSTLISTSEDISIPSIITAVIPSVVIPAVSIPTSSWTPDTWGTWPFVTISGVGATNITYLLVSLFILYVGIILYVDGDYLYNKIKDFAIRRWSNVRRNTVERLKTESGLNYLTDTLTSAWDAMRANFGVSPKAAAPHGWLTQYSPYGQPTSRPFRAGAGRRSTKRPYRKRRRKYTRKRPTELSNVYRDTTYRRKVPSSTAGGWYSGDYEADFRSSHDYQQSSQDSRSEGRDTQTSDEAVEWHRDIAFSDSDWSQRRQYDDVRESNHQQYH